jgi:hypothetical protein|tara:strand:- start:435 stop:821 length:387 start_codon:yes stop_codon:yes gene_type:complete
MAIVMDIEGVTTVGKFIIISTTVKVKSKSRKLKARWYGYDHYYRKFEMKKKHYQHFIKAYNRRTKQKKSYLTDLGYTCVRVNLEMSCGAKEAKLHCEKYVKDGAWISNGNHFIFAYDKDVTMFTLKFA